PTPTTTSVSTAGGGASGAGVMGTVLSGRRPAETPNADPNGPVSSSGRGSSAPSGANGSCGSSGDPAHPAYPVRLPRAHPGDPSPRSYIQSPLETGTAGNYPELSFPQSYTGG